MIKLCIITHSYPRFKGDWRSNFIESLAHAYARNGADVTVFVPYAIQFNRAKKDDEGVKIVNYKYAPFRSLHTIGYGHSMKSDLIIDLQDMLLTPFLLLAGIIRFTLLLRKEKFDLIQAHWAVPNTLIAIAGRFFARSKAKIFTSFPGSDVTVITSLGWIGKLLAKIIARSDYLSCNSSDLKEDLVRAGLDTRKIDYVIYGVDDNKISFSEQGRSDLRREWGVSDNDIVLLLIGRFVPKKGFSTAFQSLKYIVERKKNIRLIVVGDGPLSGEYHAILEKDRVQSYVRFIGEIPPQELRKYYSACDIFLMPSRRLPSDGLNVVVPEAMACGRAVVASDVGGNDLVIFHDSNGYLHRENEPRQLADLVLQLANDPAQRRAMGEKSLSLIRERFNWNAIARYYLVRYQKIISGDTWRQSSI
jgi:glycosyltransferase involved in cell wall biosynthesis